MPRSPVTNDGPLSRKPSRNSQPVPKSNLCSGRLVHLHLRRGTRCVINIVELQDVNDYHRSVIVSRWMRNLRPLNSCRCICARRDRQRDTTDNDGLLHTRIFMNMLPSKIRAGLHLDKRSSRRILHDSDAVPHHPVTQKHIFDIGEEHNFCANRVK